MGAPVDGYEVRYRVVDSGQEWTRLNVPRQPLLKLRGLRRGSEYEYGVRALGGGRASDYTTGTFTVPTTHRLDARALPPGTVGNVGAVWSTGASVTWSATDTLASISVGALDMAVGDAVVSYGATSADVAGTASEVKIVHLYYDDPTFLGGSLTLGVTTDLLTARTGYGRIYIATLTITYDVGGGSGTSGGGGIAGGGGGSGQIEP